MIFTPRWSLLVAGAAFSFGFFTSDAEETKPPIVSEKPTLKADARVRFLETRVAADPDDFIAWNQLGGRHLALLRETGRMEHLSKARAAAEGSLKAFANSQSNAGGFGLRAGVELAEHRFAAALKTARQLLETARDRAFPLQLLFDAQLELGQLDEAGKTLDEIKTLAPKSLETAARELRLAWQRGKIPEAIQAADAMLEAVQEFQGPATLAWAQVQRGELAFRLGDWPGAEKHYAAALAAVPASWSAREHVAELRAAEGKYPEALASLAQLVSETARPELMQAAGDVAKAAGQPEDATRWHGQAREAMLASIARGETLYTHHLSGLYADSLNQPDEAVKWARKDLQERQTVNGWDALAWALNLTGQYAEAADAAAKALATGTRDPHILYRAGLVFTSAGKLAEARAALHTAAEVNPRQQTFHFHR